MATNHWSLCRVLITGDSGSGKTNTLFNLIIHLQDIDKIYLYAKDSYEAKNQLLVDKWYDYWYA